MHARSALFDLYGDHLRARGGAAPVAALVGLMDALEITAPAVRTAVSRMVRQDWLHPVRIGAAAGYSLTARAVSRLDAAADRIYRTRTERWDGSWHVVVAAPDPSRAGRDRLRAGLGFLGYARLDGDTWVSPWVSPELDVLLEADAVHADRFRAAYDGEPGTLVRRAWDLDALATAYERWLVDARAVLAAAGPTDRPKDAFAVRSTLVHEWRKFLFTDPGLPRELLPEHWPGDEAAMLFEHEARRLLPLARQFVDEQLGATTRTEHP